MTCWNLCRWYLLKWAPHWFRTACRKAPNDRLWYLHIDTCVVSISIWNQWNNLLRQCTLFLCGWTKKGKSYLLHSLDFFFFYEYALPWQVLWFKQSWLGLHLLGCSTAHSELSCKNDRSLSAAGALPCSAILSDKNNLVQVFSNSPWGANWETGLSSKSSFRITFRSVHLQGKAHLDPLFYCILLKLFFLVT